ISEVLSVTFLNIPEENLLLVAETMVEAKYFFAKIRRHAERLCKVPIRIGWGGKKEIRRRQNQCVGVDSICRYDIPRKRLACSWILDLRFNRAEVARSLGEAWSRNVEQRGLP